MSLDGDLENVRSACRAVVDSLNGIADDQGITPVGVLAALVPNAVRLTALVVSNSCASAIKFSLFIRIFYGRPWRPANPGPVVPPRHQGPHLRLPDPSLIAPSQHLAPKAPAWECTTAKLRFGTGANHTGQP